METIQRNTKQIVEDFGDLITDNLGDFDPTDMAFTVPLMVAEAEASLVRFKAAVSTGHREAITKHAVDAATALLQVSYFLGDS